MLVWWQGGYGSGGCESRAQFPAPCSCEPPLSELCCRCRCWQPKLPTVAATPEPDLARSGATGEAAQLTVGALAHSSSPPGPPRHHHCPNTRGCCCCCCWKQQSSSRTMLPSDRNELFIINHSTTDWLFSSLKFFTCPKSVHIPMSGRGYLQSQPPPRPAPPPAPELTQPGRRGPPAQDGNSTLLAGQQQSEPGLPLHIAQK